MREVRISVQYDNPYDVGMSGLLGYGAAYEATHECDLLILLGTDFPYNAFLPDDVKIVQVDVRPEHLGRRSKLDLAVWGDVRETLRCLIPKVRPKQDRTFLDRMLKKHADALEGVVKAYTRKVEKHTPIHPEYVASVLDEEAAADAVFTVDTGMCNVWAVRYLSPNGRRRVIGSGVERSRIEHDRQAAFLEATEDGEFFQEVVRGPPDTPFQLFRRGSLRMLGVVAAAERLN